MALSPVSYLTKQTSLLLSAARKFRLGVILGKAYPYDVFSWSELPTLGSWLRDFEPQISAVSKTYILYWKIPSNGWLRMGLPNDDDNPQSIGQYNNPL